MPNHVHGLIEIHSLGDEACPQLPEIMQWYKTMTTNEYIRGVRLSGWAPFPGKLWQRSFHDHTVRNEQSLIKIERYIIDNPSRWENDRENRLLP